MTSIYIALPTTGQINGDLVKQLLDLQMDCIYNDDLDVAIRKHNGIPLDCNHNKIVKDFLATDSDYLLLVEDDVSIEGKIHDAIKKLISANKPIVSGLICIQYLGKIRPVIIKTIDGKGKYVDDFDPEPERNIKVHASGLAFTLIKRDVLEHMKKKYGAVFKYPYDEDGIVIQTEDVHFCHRAKELGYDIWVNTGILCNHHKKVNLMDVYLKKTEF